MKSDPILEEAWRIKDQLPAEAGQMAVLGNVCVSRTDFAHQTVPKEVAFAVTARPIRQQSASPRCPVD